MVTWRKPIVALALGLALGVGFAACTATVSPPSTAAATAAPAAQIAPVSAAPTVAGVVPVATVTSPNATRTTGAVAARPASTSPAAVATTPRAAASAPAARALLTVPELVKRLRPSVVHISTEAIGVNARGQPVPGGGVGTGFAIDRDGLIVTNNHVVAGAQRIVVTLVDGEAFEAEIVGRDPQTDLAVIRIDIEGLPSVTFGQSSELEVGESVVAIGHALDLPGGPTVTAGVLSAVDRTLTGIGPQRATLSDLLQTDASINPGNSGGPLLNMYGEVVGVNSAGAGGGQGISFAIAIDGARSVIDALIADGEVVRGFLGISMATITRSIARQLDLPVTAGIFVMDVVPGSAAALAGLRRNDILIAIDDVPIPDAGAVSRVLAKYTPGSTAEVTFLRPGRGIVPQRVEVTLGERPNP